MATTTTTTTSTTTSGTSGSTTVTGTSGSDKLVGGSGDDTLDGGAGSDTINAGSGNDLMIYILSANLNGAKDVYTGGSGIDTVQMQLTQSQWTDAAVRTQLQNYITFLTNVQRNATTGEVSNGSASDFTFYFANGTTLPVQMTEALQVAVLNPSTGQYVLTDFHASLVTGPTSGTVIEAGGVANALPGSPSAGGDLYADDLDGADDSFQSVAAGTGTLGGYGTYSVSATGVWAYTVDNTNAAVQALNVGQTLTDTFKVVTTDGTVQLITVTIQGSNDAAVITGTSTGTLVEAGGVSNGAAGTPTASGDLNAADVDNLADTFQVVAAGGVTANGHGTYASNAAGVWTYTLNNADAAVQALNTGNTLTDTF